MHGLRLLVLNSARKWIGEAAHTLALARGLEQRGHTVFLGVRRGCDLESQARNDGLKRIVPFTFASNLRPGSDWRDWVEMRRLVRRERIDLIHCHRGKDHWAGAAAARLGPPGHAGPPLVRTRHVVTPARSHTLNRWLYGRATQAVISVSQAAQASLGRLAAELGPPQCGVVYAAVDSERFSPTRRNEAVRERFGVDAEAPFVGLIARIQRVKGQRQFLEAASQVARRCPTARFLVAGRGLPGRLEALQAHADAAGLPRECLTLAGELDDLPQVLASLDLGIVASVGSEGSSRIALEYMASGVAVVATCVGAVPELVGDGAEGLVVPPDDPPAMAREIERLLRDRSLRRTLGESGRRSALERFGTGRWITETENVYRAVLHRGS